MQAIAGVIATAAVLCSHVVAHLPTDSVAVEVLRYDLSQVDAIALAEEDTADVVTVQELVIHTIAIETYVLDTDVRYSEPIEKRKQRGRAGTFLGPEVLHQHFI